MPPAVANRHVEANIVDYAVTRSPATVSQARRTLQQFFNWLVRKDEIATNPTADQGSTVPKTLPRS